MKILVAGIGNIFLGDDGFGSEVARRLLKRRLPEGVIVEDFGIRGLDLAYALLERFDLAILIDACPRGAAPGTVSVIEPDPAGHAAGIDPHSMDPMTVLSSVKSLGGAGGPIRIVGCEPADLGPAEGKIGLSEPVAAALDEAVRVIESLIERTTTAAAGV